VISIYSCSGRQVRRSLPRKDRRNESEFHSVGSDP
jgi:hypothetical protein